MRIKHHVYGEVDGVEKKVDIDGVARSWKKKVNGCYMTWLAIDDWEEVVEPKFVDAMEDVVVTPEGELRLCSNGTVLQNIWFNDKWRFEKVTMYDLPKDIKKSVWPVSIPPWDWLDQFRRECLIAKKKVRGS